MVDKDYSFIKVAHLIKFSQEELDIMGACNPKCNYCDGDSRYMNCRNCEDLGMGDCDHNPLILSDLELDILCPKEIKDELSKQIFHLKKS